MRRSGGPLLVLVIAILAGSASPASAHRFPADCTGNGADLVLRKDRTTVRPGRVITYSLFASNNAPFACEVTNAGVTLKLPSLTGAPSAIATPITSGQPLPAGTPETLITDFPYTVNVNAGVANAVAEATATGTVHDSPADSQATIVKSIGTQVTQPSLGFTFGAAPLAGFAPFTTTYTFVVSNTSTTPVPMDPPVIQHTSCPATYASGDGNTIGVLENGESWRYTCTRLFPAPTAFSSSSTANANSRVDTETVLAPTSSLVTVTANRPPAATLVLSRDATPRVGPAPLTVAHTYTLSNTSGADPRPVKNPTITDALCSPVARTSGGDDLLSAGETWTYACTQTLATAGSISGTAVANGPDDLGFNTISSSNLAAIEVEATAVNPAPTPVPTISPTGNPTASPTPTPTATPTPSARVNFSTVSGRFARCTTRTATAQLKVGSRVIATKRFRLDSRCRYKVRFTNVTRSRLRGATRVSVTVRSGRRTATHRVSVPRL
jgi:hypothetical protein